MFLIIKNINSHPLFIRSYTWLKLIGITGFSQIIVQAIGFISGIIIIRTLSTEEYALYTLANMLLSTMVVLANTGIATGVMAQAGKVWSDKNKLGVILVSGFNLRKKFAIVSLLLGLPILIFLLIKNNASLIMTLFLVISIIPAFVVALSTSLLEIPPKLHQDIVPLQKNQLTVNLGRLILLLLTIFVFPLAVVAIFSSSLPQILGNIKLRKIASEHVDFKQSASVEVSNNILGTVKRILPESIYYSFSGQVTIWLLSIFGSTVAIAEIGALGRLSMFLGLISVLFNTLISPRFARLVDNYKLLLNRFVMTLFLMFFVFLFIVILSSLFSRQILFVLGPNYLHLEEEFILAILGASLSGFAGIIYWLYSSRGWIINPIISISLNLVTLVVAIIVTDISTLKGVLILNIIVALVQLFTHGFYGLYRIFKLKRTQLIS